MAFITLAGTIQDPNSDMSIGDQIRFTQQSTTGQTLKGAVSVVTVSVLGTYSVNLQYGLVLVEYRPVKNPNFRSLGIKTVNADNPATSIPELLIATVPVSSADLIAFQALLADSVAARDAAVVAQVAAEAAADAVDTFASLIALSPTITGTPFTCQERASAPYILKISGYVALAGDATFANGRVAQLQIDGQCPLAWFGAAQNGESLLDAATDDLAACNLAALRMQQEGGGTLLMSGLAALSGKLIIPQRVVFEGTSLFFANQYIDTSVRPAGCGFYGLVGANADFVDVKLDIYNDGGTLRETVNNKVLMDYRHFGGVRNLIIYGNRSNTANPPTTVDKNTSGNGLVLSGVRYPVIENVISMFNADKGVRAVSFDYGLGANACNNLFTSSLVTLSNAVGGMDLSGGDSIMRGLYSGYNGGTGIVSNMGRSVIEYASWNNKFDGIFITGSPDSEYKGKAYDNDRTGWRVTGTKDCKVSGRSSANGRDTAFGATDRCGVISGSDNIDLAIDIQDSGAYLGVVYQQYGLRILQSANKVNVCSSSSIGNNLGDWLVTNPLMLDLHGNLPRGGNHAGFTLTDKILCDGNEIAEIGGISGDVWSGATATTGTINVARNSFVSINEASPVNVTDIISTIEGIALVVFRISGGSDITFMNNNTKLRLNGGINRTISIYESISFVYIGGTVWQEV